MHLRMTGNLVWWSGRRGARPLRGQAAVRGRALDLRASPPRPLRARRWPRAVVHRPAPLRRGLPHRRCGSRGALRAARGRAALRRVHGGGAGQAAPPGARHPSSPSCSTSRRSPGSGTSTQTRRCSGHGCTRSRPPARCAPSTTRRCATRSSPRWRRGSTGAAPRSTTTGTGAASGAAMQDEFLVHTREGEPCPRCGDPIARIVVAGRSTYYCPGCQVRLRRRPRRRSRPARRST